MTGYNRMNQRLAIVKTRETIEQPKYVPCPVCGTLMANLRRAKAHCNKVPGEK